jgi:hypothetical protein
MFERGSPGAVDATDIDLIQRRAAHAGRTNDSDHSGAAYDVDADICRLQPRSAARLQQRLRAVSWKPIAGCTLLDDELPGRHGRRSARQRLERVGRCHATRRRDVFVPQRRPRRQSGANSDVGP